MVLEEKRVKESAKEWKEFCPECGEVMDVWDDEENYEWAYSCPHCGYEDADSYEDLFGPMSVPWGGV
jgi:predicted RNA-binding Zn-ribbon protein involved in translation (DUF1610 family)